MRTEGQRPVLSKIITKPNLDRFDYQAFERYCFQRKSEPHQFKLTSISTVFISSPCACCPNPLGEGATAPALRFVVGFRKDHRSMPTNLDR